MYYAPIILRNKLIILHRKLIIIEYVCTIHSRGVGVVVVVVLGVVLIVVVVISQVSVGSVVGHFVTSGI